MDDVVCDGCVGVERGGVRGDERGRGVGGVVGE